CLALGLVLVAVVPMTALADSFTGPVALQTDNLTNPLGIDDPAPRFSWQLQDPTNGAAQTSYQIQVASSAELLRQNTADIWSSGVVRSSQSMNTVYAGPALKPSTRYF